MTIVNAARWVSLVAAFVVGAVAEYNLARRVGYDQYTAALLPLVLDVWGFAAFRTGRTWHVVGALVAMFAVQTTSHLLELGEAPTHMVALSIAVSAIPPAVSLACHRLGVEPAETPQPELQPEVQPDPQPEPQPEPQPDQQPESQPDQQPESQPDQQPESQPDQQPESQPDQQPESQPEPSLGVHNNTPASTGDRPDKATIAARGRALIAAGYTKKAAAEELGISRQWLHKCLTAC